MACALTLDYTYLFCKGGVGGIKNVFLTEIGNVATFTVTAGVVTAFTLATGKEFKVYNLEQEFGMFTNPLTFTKASGAISYDPTVTFSLKKITTAMIQEINLIAQNTLLIIVEDNQGRYWLFGAGNSASAMNGRGMDLMTAGTDSGTLLKDFNGHKLDFKGQEIGPILEVTSSLISVLSAPAV